MKKWTYYLDNIEEMLIAALLPIMCIVVVFSTFFRYAKLPVMAWGEELARYLMIWIVFIGLGVGARRNAHFYVQAVIGLFPKRLQKYFEVFRIGIVVVFCIIIICLSFSIIQAQIKMGQISPSLHIPMWMVYLAIPVGCAFMVIRSIQYLYHALKDGND